MGRREGGSAQTDLSNLVGLAQPGRLCWKPYAVRALREKGTLTEVEAEIASWKRK